MQCHFSGWGERAAAELWFGAVVDALSNASSDAGERSIERTIAVNAPPVHTWLTVSNYPTVGWMPQVERASAYGLDIGAFAERVSTIKGGGIVIDKLTDISNDLMRIVTESALIDAPSLPVSKIRLEGSVHPAPSDSSELTLTLRYRPARGRDAGEVDAVMSDYLSGLLIGAESQAEKMSR